MTAQEVREEDSGRGGKGGVTINNLSVSSNASDPRAVANEVIRQLADQLEREAQFV